MDSSIQKRNWGLQLVCKTALTLIAVSIAQRKLLNWRRGWDSNPRYARAYNGFRDRPVRPLRHPSALDYIGLFRSIDRTLQRLITDWSQAAELSSVPRFPSADFRALSTLMTAPWRRPGLAWDQRSRPTGGTSALATRPLVRLKASLSLDRPTRPTHGVTVWQDSTWEISDENGWPVDTTP